MSEETPEVSQDVAAEQNTAEAPSAEDQTVEESEAQAAPIEGEAQVEAETQDNKIPYNRFKEVNEKNKQLEERLKEYEDSQAKARANENPEQAQIREALQKMGFVSKEEVNQELRRREEDQRLEQTFQQLESTYSGKDGRPKFSRQEVIDFCLQEKIPSPEAGYKLMHEKALIDWHIRQASGKARGTKSEASDGSGSANVGTSNEDLKAAIKAGDKSALRTFIKRQSKF